MWRLQSTDPSEGLLCLWRFSRFRLELLCQAAEHLGQVCSRCAASAHAQVEEILVGRRASILANPKIMVA